VTDKAAEISNLLAPTVESLGVELLGIEYLPGSGGATLRLYIDVPAGEADQQGESRLVGIEDCEAVSREVSAQLDVEDPISGNYTLEVSSPGIDRPLFNLEHFKRFQSETAKVTLKLPQEGRSGADAPPGERRDDHPDLLGDQHRRHEDLVGHARHLEPGRAEHRGEQP